MTLKSLVLVLTTVFFISNIAYANGITRLERVGTFNNQAQDVRGLAICQDKSGNVFQVKLSTVEYIILLQSGKVAFCNLSSKPKKGE